MHVLDDLEHVAHGSHDDITLRAIRECKAALEKQIAKMDGLEAGFDKIAERSRKCHLRNTVSSKLTKLIIHSSVVRVEIISIEKTL